MPWNVKRDTNLCSESEPWCVVNADTGDLVACHATEEKAKAQQRALYANMPAGEMMQRRNAPVEWRTAQLGDVNFSQRIVTVIAVPYEQRTKIPFDGEVWDEMFLRGAFNGIQTKQRFSVNRDHDKTRTIGKVLKYYPDRVEGLVIDAYVAETPLGDETLALASKDCLSASIGFAARRADQVLDRRTMTRSIKRAFLDHLAFVPDPAYEGAQVISVRNTDGGAGFVRTPAIDEYLSDPLIRWVESRLT